MSGVKPQFRQPCRMRHARLVGQRLVPGPERCLLPACHAQHHDEGRQAHAIGLGTCIEFMQGAARERKTRRSLCWMILLGREGGRHVRKPNVHDMFCINKGRTEESRTLAPASLLQEVASWKCLPGRAGRLCRQGLSASRRGLAHDQFDRQFSLLMAALALDLGQQGRGTELADPGGRDHHRG